MVPQGVIVCCIQQYDLGTARKPDPICKANEGTIHIDDISTTIPVILVFVFFFSLLPSSLCTHSQPYPTTHTDSTHTLTTVLLLHNTYKLVDHSDKNADSVAI